MLPEALLQHPTASALAAWNEQAIVGGSQEFGETTLWVNPTEIQAVCARLRDAHGFERLAGLSCIDRYPMEPRFEVFYLLHSIARNERLKLKVALAGDAPALATVTPVWAGADWYEREAYDLFGVHFEGHPDLRRIMMPDNWEGHPLRRDFPTHGHKYSYQND